MFLTRNLLKPSWHLMIFMFFVFKLCGGMGGGCPNVCTCKWKGGKQTVECMDRNLITVPEKLDIETQVLDLSGNNLQILPRETFVRVGLLNLQRLFLRSCRIGQIDDRAFRGLTNLIELDLSHNLLTAIPSAIFQDIPSLRDLILSDNPIQKVEPRTFQRVPGLVRLDLSNCELQLVASRALEGIELLESLKLNGNRLSELGMKTVETLTSLHGIELHDNPWYCDCRLRPVKEWLSHYNIPYSIAPVCSGGPERVIQKTFAELHVDDFACKPEIQRVITHIKATAGENVTIMCRASAIPPAHINWYWNGRLLVNNSAFSSFQRIYIFEEGHFDKRSNLILTNVQEADSSEFYCVAENRGGNAETNFTLHVAAYKSGLVSLGSGQIAGLSAALVILILLILLIILMMLVRIRRVPYVDTKVPGQVEVVTVVNGAAIPNGKAAVSPTNVTVETSSFTERKIPAELNFCNPVQKPPRLNEIPYSTAHYNGNGSVMNPGSCFVSPSSGSGNNPDLINDTKLFGSEETTTTTTEDCYTVEALERAGSGEYSRNADSLYPSGIWENPESESFSRSTANVSFHYDDKTPIIGDGTSAGGSVEELNFRLNHGTNRAAGYPSDYGLPIVAPKTETTATTSAAQVNLPTNAKTLRVWQKGGVPVLPPVTALKRALSHNRNSPDEGYQEGCGTDV